ncbi:DUF397 domain-containing protein [Solihabitans fulvus]|uniref:DUF397 domain-containing protein n=1 Tax=Solihabitans fulvus TaxID=1892852 RepID=A0A5B2WTV7_9PSEU|nr:DUF397 domain-containing protein [Solihabitans fulvus]KAA2254284.1 DUF397 domain-containing protein [Solihabitans fulvus]
MQPDLSRANWRKSSRSGGSGGNGTGGCVELATLPPHTAVRDSKNPSGPTLVFAAERLTTFLVAAKLGSYDLG